MMKYAAAVVLAASLSACTTEVTESVQIEEIKVLVPPKWIDQELDTIASDTIPPNE